MSSTRSKASARSGHGRRGVRGTVARRHVRGSQHLPVRAATCMRASIRLENDGHGVYMYAGGDVYEGGTSKGGWRARHVSPRGRERRGWPLQAGSDIGGRALDARPNPRVAVTKRQGDQEHPSHQYPLLAAPPACSAPPSLPALTYPAPCSPPTSPSYCGALRPPGHRRSRSRRQHASLTLSACVCPRPFPGPEGSGSAPGHIERDLGEQLGGVAIHDSPTPPPIPDPDPGSNPNPGEQLGGMAIHDLQSDLQSDGAAAVRVAG